MNDKEREALVDEWWNSLSESHQGWWLDTPCLSDLHTDLLDNVDVFLTWLIKKGWKPPPDKSKIDVDPRWDKHLPVGINRLHLASLCQNHREIIYMRELDKLSYDTIAAIMMITPDEVREQEKDAYKRMAKMPQED